MESYWLETDIDNEVGIVFEILLAEAWDRQRGRYVLFFESYWLEPGIDNEVGTPMPAEPVTKIKCHRYYKNTGYTRR